MCLVDAQAQGVYYAGAVRGIGLKEVLHLQLLNTLWGMFQTSRDIANQAFAGVRLRETEEIARLRVVIAVQAVIVAVDCAADRPGALTECGVLTGTAKTVRLIVDGRAGISIEAHGAVTVVGVKRALGFVDWERVVIDTQAIAMRVGIR